MKIEIVGYGNVGKHIYEEFKSLSPTIYDPKYEEYNIKSKEFFDFSFICVPTDSNEDGSCDISIVNDAVRKCNADVVILKSTVPVRLTDFLGSLYNKNIVFSPEYYGTTLHSYNECNFLILGGDSKNCSKVAQLYYKVKPSNFRILFSDASAAELAKYMENCFLGLKVTFCNEFAEVAEAYGVNYEQLRELFVADERVGQSHTYVYKDQPYYDSHCLNKDIPAFIHIAQDAGIEPDLMKTVNKVNQKKKRVS